MRIGVLSDTHGILPQQALKLLQGVEWVIHAGDIGRQEIIDRLKSIAPVSAVTGNVDWGSPLDRHFPRSLSLTLAGCSIYVTHIGGKPSEFSRHLPTPRPDVAICGHSHIPLLEQYEGVLYLNPGSAGQPRFGRGRSLAILMIEQGRPKAKILQITEEHS